MRINLQENQFERRIRVDNNKQMIKFKENSGESFGWLS